MVAMNRFRNAIWYVDDDNKLFQITKDWAYQKSSLTQGTAWVGNTPSLDAF